MAKFVRFRKDEFLNLDKVVSYTLCRVIYEDYEEGQHRPDKYFIRFLLDCENLGCIMNKIRGQ